MTRDVRTNICVIELECFLPDVHSLKEKRMILRKIKDRVGRKFNVSIAEVGYQDLWQRSVIGIAAVNGDRRLLEQVKDKVLNEIEQIIPGGVTHFTVDFL
ncbi:MAG: DUF503 domain-containing protein [Acidobacteria bacterium]|nr:DUF503 domain-containing protein [Acidobacteriota bacterium]